MPAVVTKVKETQEAAQGMGTIQMLNTHGFGQR